MVLTLFSTLYLPLILIFIATTAVCSLTLWVSSHAFKFSKKDYKMAFFSSLLFAAIFLEISIISILRGGGVLPHISGFIFIALITKLVYREKWPKSLGAAAIAYAAFLLVSFLISLL